MRTLRDAIDQFVLWHQSHIVLTTPQSSLPIQPEPTSGEQEVAPPSPPTIVHGCQTPPPSTQQLAAPPSPSKVAGHEAPLPSPPSKVAGPVDNGNSTLPDISTPATTVNR